MEPDGPCQKSTPLDPILSQTNPVNNPYPLSPKSIVISSTHLCLGLPSGLLPSVFPTNNQYAFSSSSFTWSFELLLAKSISYEAPHSAALSIFLALHLSSAKIFSSAPYSQIPSVYVSPLMSETKFATNTEPQAEL
jgi:hypothetical protein